MRCPATVAGGVARGLLFQFYRSLHHRRARQGSPCSHPGKAETNSEPAAFQGTPAPATTVLPGGGRCLPEERQDQTMAGVGKERVLLKPKLWPKCKHS